MRTALHLALFALTVAAGVLMILIPFVTILVSLS